jgi:hypothetical protein
LIEIHNRIEAPRPRTTHYTATAKLPHSPITIRDLADAANSLSLHPSIPPWAEVQLRYSPGELIAMWSTTDAGKD